MYLTGMSRSIICFLSVLIFAGIAIADSKFTYKIEATDSNGKPAKVKVRCSGVMKVDGVSKDVEEEFPTTAPFTYTTKKEYYSIAISVVAVTAERMKLVLIEGDEKTGKVVAEKSGSSILVVSKHAQLKK